MPDVDPRVTGAYLRRLSGTDSAGSVTLVGVVHDHPASVVRVQEVVAATDPDHLALELPPVAVPLFVEYAGRAGSPNSLGGEMSAAIRAASTDHVTGIDGPSPAFVRSLCGRLARGRASGDTVRAVGRSLWSVTKHALRCRAAATCARVTGVTFAVDERIDHACSLADDPATQAAAEREQVRRARMVTKAFQPSAASHLRRETREAHMTRRLQSIRQEGNVTAVVGIGHLDALATALRESSRPTSPVGPRG
jgi:hypothetical protein